MVKVAWSAKAVSHLQGIHSYIAEDSRLYAHRFITSLIKATLRLQRLPLCGRIVPELKQTNLREVLFRNYRIIYRFKESALRVEIVSVIHSARDIRNLPKEEWEL
jgi:plasmid stabilization system protein ParE